MCKAIPYKLRTSVIFLFTFVHFCSFCSTESLKHHDSRTGSDIYV